MGSNKERKVDKEVFKGSQVERILAWFGESIARSPGISIEERLLALKNDRQRERAMLVLNKLIPDEIPIGMNVQDVRSAVAIRPAGETEYHFIDVQLRHQPRRALNRKKK